MLPLADPVFNNPYIVKSGKLEDDFELTLNYCLFGNNNNTGNINPVEFNHQKKIFIYVIWCCL